MFESRYGLSECAKIVVRVRGKWLVFGMFSGPVALSGPEVDRGHFTVEIQTDLRNGSPGPVSHLAFAEGIKEGTRKTVCFGLVPMGAGRTERLDLAGYGGPQRWREGPGTSVPL